MRSALIFRPTKFYCIIYSRVLLCEPGPAEECDLPRKRDYCAWEDDDAVEMGEKLLCYATKCDTQTVDKNDRDSFVSAFVRCEPNESGQGFTSCLLDVSAFPAGHYRIRWRSCCVDKKGNYWNLLPLNAGPVFTVQYTLFFAYI